MNNQCHDSMLAAPRQAVQGGGMLTAFRDLEQMFRVSDYLAKSPIVPKAFLGQPGSVMIALNMAQRLRMDPFMVMQNIVVVNGNAGLSGKFAMALLNRSPKYVRLEYRYVNGRDFSGGMQVVGHRADDPEDACPDVGTAVTPQMVEAEGWGRNPKWRSMPEQMFRYRAASFFARAFVPEELMGLQTAEELEDVALAAGAPRNVSPVKPALPGPVVAGQDEAGQAPAAVPLFRPACGAAVTEGMDEIPGLEGAGRLPEFGAAYRD